MCTQLLDVLTPWVPQLCTHIPQTASCNLCEAFAALLCHRDLLRSLITGSGIVQTQLFTLLLHKVHGPDLPHSAGQWFPSPCDTNPNKYLPPANVSAIRPLSSHMLLHATCTYMQSWIHSAGGHLQLISEGPYARDTRTRGVARSHTIFRAEGVQPCFGDGSLTIREHYALADANVALYKFPSWRLPAHPALLLSPFFLLQMP